MNEPTIVFQRPCGPTQDDAECACGCSGYEDRCDYWLALYKVNEEVGPSHACCKVFR